MMAAYSGHTEIVQKLLANHASVDLKDKVTLQSALASSFH